MNPVMKFSPGDNGLPSDVLCSCPSSISTAEINEFESMDLNGRC